MQQLPESQYVFAIFQVNPNELAAPSDFPTQFVPLLVQVKSNILLFMN